MATMMSTCLVFNTQAHLPLKRAREESDSESDRDNTDGNTTRMDYQQAGDIGDRNGNPNCSTPHLPPPLNVEHAALRSDLETITQMAMDRLYLRITRDMKKSAADSMMAFQQTTDRLQSHILSLGMRVTQLQQKVFTKQHSTQSPKAVPAMVPVQKVLKLKLSKKNTGDDTARTAPAPRDTTLKVVSTTVQMLTANTRGWETVQSGGKKKKPAAMPKLIPTKYPQTKCEVTCHFDHIDVNGATTLLEKMYTERQILADVTLQQINSAFVDNKDVLVPSFIGARVTTRGSIVFTTGYHNSNLVYEDYISIIIDALSYYGKCEKVEIGKRFSPFLLYGVPTHLSIPEISDSIKTNYPQLIQGQTPRWLTPADCREHKANSTIVITLTGNVKKADIGRQNLIVGNCKCQLDDYISFGRSTQCHKCQAYGHPATLCHNDPRCAVCAEPHETREHPCTLPTCKKGPTCTHPPIRCANCGTEQNASDPNCPERIKL